MGAEEVVVEAMQPEAAGEQGNTPVGYRLVGWMQAGLTMARHVWERVLSAISCAGHERGRKGPLAWHAALPPSRHMDTSDQLISHVTMLQCSEQSLTALPLGLDPVLITRRLTRYPILAVVGLLAGSMPPRAACLGGLETGRRSRRPSGWPHGLPPRVPP